MSRLRRYRTHNKSSSKKGRHRAHESERVHAKRFFHFQKHKHSVDDEEERGGCSLMSKGGRQRRRGEKTAETLCQQQLESTHSMCLVVNGGKLRKLVLFFIILPTSHQTHQRCDDVKRPKTNERKAKVFRQHLFLMMNFSQRRASRFQNINFGMTNDF